MCVSSSMVVRFIRSHSDFITAASSEVKGRGVWFGVWGIEITRTLSNADRLGTSYSALRS